MNLFYPIKSNKLRRNQIIAGMLLKIILPSEFNNRITSLSRLDMVGNQVREQVHSRREIDACIASNQRTALSSWKLIAHTGLE